MLKEAWDSFKDNIKERVSNPFLGTFVLVWIVHNWKVVYAFFFFDEGFNLEKRIQFFKDYWNDKSFVWNIIVVAFITITILIITYLFLSLSRYLSNAYENIIIPQISKHTKGKIVLDETYQNALAQIKSLETRLEVERKAKVEAIQEREQMEEKLYKNNNLVIDGGVIGGGNEVSKNNSKEHDRDFSDLIKKVKQNPKLSKMEEILIQIAKKFRFYEESEANGIDFLLKNGLIYHDKSDSYGRYYNFTEEGIMFKNQYFAES